MEAKEIYERCNSKYYQENPGDFEKDVESYFTEFKAFHPDLKSKIHSKAYQDGHASGYSDTFTQYFDLVEIAYCALKTAKRIDAR